MPNNVSRRKQQKSREAFMAKNNVNHKQLGRIDPPPFLWKVGKVRPFPSARRTWSRLNVSICPNNECLAEYAGLLTGEKRCAKCKRIFVVEL